MNKELRERIATFLGKVYRDGVTLDHLSVRLELASQILALIKEAGWQATLNKEMKIDPRKAIELLQRGILERPNPFYQDLTDAMKLGIEALRVLVIFRDNPWALRFDKLPDETKD